MANLWSSSLVASGTVIAVDNCVGSMFPTSRRSRGRRPKANSMGVLPLMVTTVFRTAAALRKRVLAVTALSCSRFCCVQPHATKQRKAS